jgi:hypothetical protein
MYITNLLVKLDYSFDLIVKNVAVADVQIGESPTVIKIIIA